MEATIVLFSTRDAARVHATTAFAATFLKVAALTSTLLTLLLAAIVLSWQGGAWILSGEWNSLSISQILALAGYDVSPANRAATGIEMIFGWGLDLPASGFLLMAAAILTGFSVFAANAEEQFGKR
jgi:hypothetical protein